MRALSLTVVFAGALLLAFPTGSDSCGISPPVPVFSAAQGPANLDSEFLKGKVGVVRPSFGRRYLIGAYRMLSGKPLSAAESDALFQRRRTAVLLPAGANPGGPFGWGQAVAQVPGANRVPYTNPYKNKADAGSVVYFENCPDAAFDSALQTMADRRRQWGASDPRLRDWANAQQKVFANCSDSNLILPDPPAPGMDALLAADRRYQIAAAYFYNADWANARDAFTQIATDASSPWRGIAPYLVARTFIREGTVDEKADALQEAAKRLQAIVDDPAQQQWHDASRKLLEYVNLRIDPTARLEELGKEITGAQPASDFGQSVTDFLYLYGRQQRSGADVTALENSSDLADWMLTFEGQSPKVENHAATQWKKTRNAAWLIATLSQGDDPEAIEAARHLDPNSPAYESAAYYALLRQSDPDEARRWADEALSRKLTLSARNLILTERLKRARDWSEFLRYAPRRPEPKVEAFDQQEAPAEKPPVPTATAALLDTDATAAFNHSVPFSLWVDATRNAALPPHVQLQIAEAAWVRAVVLGKDADAHALMERVVQLRPEWTSTAREYLAASDPEAARFDAAFLLLRAPEVTPFIEAGSNAGNLAQVSRLGSIQWGFVTACRYEPPIPQSNSSFLSAPQQAENEAEAQRMKAEAPSGSGYLASHVLAWARSHPEDPRIPEALHIVVQLGRRACWKSREEMNYGKTAFQLLHQRYPESEWTQKTRYWY